jgi:hypothetical protein
MLYNAICIIFLRMTNEVLNGSNDSLFIEDEL